MSKPSGITPTALEDRANQSGKLFSPSAARNSAPIRDILSPFLPQNARILEIGSGTGEHAEAVCLSRPDVIWTPSDPDEEARQSQLARSAEIPNLHPPLALDLMDSDWADGLGAFEALTCCNVIHISPWDVAVNLAQAADGLLEKDGFVFLYGPFLEGDLTAPSNLQFDASLKSRNPAWGVRALDAVTELFAQHKFKVEERVDMPANNLSLVFKRA